MARFLLPRIYTVDVGNPSWSITLIDKFEVRRPDGSRLRFRTRKAEALVALLALNNGKPIPRTDLAAKLWPGADRNSQMTSLRQALLIARSAFDDSNAIDSDRHGCRLNLSTWTCDAVEALEGRTEYPSGSLLPAMTEEAFESWRIELACIGAESEELSATAALPVLLDWALSYDPSRVLEIAHATPELISALPLDQWGRTLATSLEVAKPHHPLFAWGHLQLANVLMWRGNYKEALTHAKLAVRFAESSGDAHTLTGALFIAAYLFTMLGKWDRAVQLIDSGRRAIDDKRAITQSRRFDHVLGHVHAHRGDVGTAVQAIVRNHISEPEFNEESSWAFRTIHRSCYLALLGKTQEAWREYDAAQSISKRLSHPLLETQMLLAKATTLLAENHKEEAIQAFQSLEKQGRQLGTIPTVINALEGMAFSLDDPIERANRFAQADLLRHEHQIPVLPIDQLRLHP